MEPALVLLIIALLLATLVTALKAHKQGNGDVFAATNLNLLTGYAKEVVRACEQEFLKSDLTREELGRRRKARAEEMMVAYAKQLGMDITPALMTVISASIEAAVRYANTEAHW